MKTQNDNELPEIDWSEIDREKAEFFYNEAVARLDNIHKNIDVVTNKALSMLSFSVPVLAALTGFFVVQWGGLSPSLLVASVCSVILLFAIIVLLLMILFPKGSSCAHGEPKSYLSNDFYRNDMENILKGNIQAVHDSINDDFKLSQWRGNLFRFAVLLFAAFPVIVTIVWAVTSAVTST